jgi:hypothetical protein
LQILCGAGSGTLFLSLGELCINEKVQKLDPNKKLNIWIKFAKKIHLNPAIFGCWIPVPVPVPDTKMCNWQE